MYHVPTAPPARQGLMLGFSWVVVSAFSLGVVRPLLEQALTLIFHQSGWRVDDRLALWSLLTGIGYTLIRALLRAMVLRPAFGALRLWVPLSLASVLALSLAAPLLNAGISALVAGIADGTWRLIAALAIHAAISGIITATAEWYALRRVAPRAWRWIPAATVGTLIAQVGWELANRAGYNLPVMPIGLEILRSSITGWLLARFIVERATFNRPAEAGNPAILPSRE